MGQLRNWIGVSWWCLLACGGISERSVSDETGGTSSGGATNHAGRGGASSHAGNPATAAGGSGPVTGIVTGGATMTAPQPHRDSGVACYNDTDCPGRACGDEVCNWTRTAVAPMGEKVFSCNAAGTQTKGRDGWCTTDADDKCQAQGAKCIAPYCSFTRTQDAPAH